MIIRDEDTHWVCTQQDEHARLSAQIFKAWGDPDLQKKKWRINLHTAIAEHDRAWIPLDQQPIWNDDEGAPYDFTNYPEAEKIAAYETGINEVEMMDPNAGLLVGRHLESFFTSITTDDAERFKRREQTRFTRLRGSMESEFEKEALPILKMCDELSLFACMNRPGAAKQDEVSWFRQGFSMRFSFLNDEIILPSWKNNTVIALEPSPLHSDVHFPLKQRRILKEKVKSKGLFNSYHETVISTQIVTFTSQGG
ncbi:hypothetical protein HNR44_001031 [Geomicrobium halophilum]|uniref:DUF3891 domain-containing protein n=1 Tax=Geomicrobium halophilum TaxID=549000 RepID=A0A841PXY6_9BACL|nr:DUF3891 family protein [Geomicrobium halophilum]MBB6449082.1 hypothetical protein [Geomicrobium halophilum]